MVGLIPLPTFFNNMSISTLKIFLCEKSRGKTLSLQEGEAKGLRDEPASQSKTRTLFARLEWYENARRKGKATKKTK